MSCSRFARLHDVLVAKQKNLKDRDMYVETDGDAN